MNVFKRLLLGQNIPKYSSTTGGNVNVDKTKSVPIKKGVVNVNVQFMSIEGGYFEENSGAFANDEIKDEHLKELGVKTKKLTMKGSGLDGKGKQIVRKKRANVSITIASSGDADLDDERLEALKSAASIELLKIGIKKPKFDAFAMRGTGQVQISVYSGSRTNYQKKVMKFKKKINKLFGKKEITKNLNFKS